MERDDRAAQLRKGVLELAIMAMLHEAETYGGQLVERLAQRPALAASPGTVYPLLSRLRSTGVVETTWRESPVGPPRKYYRLTNTGLAALAEMAISWRDLSAAMTAILKDVTY